MPASGAATCRTRGGEEGLIHGDDLRTRLATESLGNPVSRAENLYIPGGPQAHLKIGGLKGRRDHGKRWRLFCDSERRL